MFFLWSKFNKRPNLTLVIGNWTEYCFIQEIYTKYFGSGSIWLRLNQWCLIGPEEREIIFARKIIQEFSMGLTYPRYVHKIQGGRVTNQKVWLPGRSLRSRSLNISVRPAETDPEIPLPMVARYFWKISRGLSRDSPAQWLLDISERSTEEDPEIPLPNGFKILVNDNRGGSRDSSSKVAHLPFRFCR